VLKSAWNRTLSSIQNRPSVNWSKHRLLVNLARQHRWSWSTKTFRSKYSRSLRQPTCCHLMTTLAEARQEETRAITVRFWKTPTPRKYTACSLCSKVCLTLTSLHQREARVLASTPTCNTCWRVRGKLSLVSSGRKPRQMSQSKNVKVGFQTSAHP